jgi:hypothetical protein
MTPAVPFRQRIAAFLSTDFVKVSLVTAAWWLVIFCAANYSVFRFGNERIPDVSRTGTSFLLLPFFNYDAGWYWKIATTGYTHAIGPINAFYPGFPLSVRFLHAIAHVNPVAAGYFLNFASTILATSALYLLALDFTKKNRDTAWNAIFLFLFFPFAFFLSAFYSEALFCALSFSAFYLARTRRWLRSCLLLAALTAVRLPGLIVVAAVFVEYLDSINWRLRNLTPKILCFILAPLGFVAYGCFLYVQTGDFWGMFHAYQSNEWGYQQFNPNVFQTIGQEITRIVQTVVQQPPHWTAIAVNYAIPFGFWLLFAFVTATSFKKIPKSYAFLLIASLLMFIINGNFVSANRYVLTLFPVYLVVAVWCNDKPRIYSFVFGTSALMLGIFLLLFSNGMWVA